MAPNETSVEPIEVPKYISPFTVAHLSGGLQITSVDTRSEKTTITVETQKAREELLKVLRSTGFPILGE